jgi:hypothetical protein
MISRFDGRGAGGADSSALPDRGEPGECQVLPRQEARPDSSIRWGSAGFSGCVFVAVRPAQYAKSPLADAEKDRRLD